MASDEDLVSLGPWPLGVDNRKSDHAVPRGTLRAAENIILTSDGHARRRDGLTERLAGACHSAWSNGSTFLLVRAENLETLTRNPSGTITATTLRSGMNMDGVNFPLVCASIDGIIYWSNGDLTGKIVNGVNRSWGVELPALQPTCTALTTGGLHAGRYQVTLTFIDDLGEESGARAGVLVNVVEGGGILVAGISQPADANVDFIRVYVTEADSETFYLWTTLAVGTTTYTVTASSNPGRKLSTQFLVPPPPATLLCVHDGRIYGVDGKNPWFTESLRYGAMKYSNRLAFEAIPTMLASVDGGLFVAADKTYFLAGGDPTKFLPREVFPYGALKGSAIQHPDRPGVLWLSEEGFCYGSPDGSAINLTQTKIALRDGLESGALVYKEENGVKQIIGAMAGGDVVSPLESTEYTEVN